MNPRFSCVSFTRDGVSLVCSGVTTSADSAGKAAGIQIATHDLTMKPTGSPVRAGINQPAHPTSKQQRRGFTRWDVCAAVTALLFLVILALPALASGQSRGHVAQCLNNLRLMGRAVQMWASDHSGETPWRTYEGTPGSPLDPREGTRPDPGEGNKPAIAWYEYLALTNEIQPRLLACPADSDVKIPANFRQYATSGFRQAATSYSINVESITQLPGAMLFADRNMKFDSLSGSCDAGIANARTFFTLGNSQNGWTNDIHGLSGNVVLLDGSALQTTTSQLRFILRRSDLNGSMHVIHARQ